MHQYMCTNIAIACRLPFLLSLCGWGSVAHSSQPCQNPGTALYAGQRHF